MKLFLYRQGETLKAYTSQQITSDTSPKGEFVGIAEMDAPDNAPTMSKASLFQLDEESREKKRDFEQALENLLEACRKL